MDGPRESELTALCRSCGLCCDGSLFGLVPVDADERELVRRKRLRLVGSGNGFEQPCAALARAPVASLDGGRACSIYDERPRSCRRFVCRLHERHRREGGSLEPRLAAVRRVRDLLASLEASPPATQPPTELTQRLEEDFARA